MILLGLCAGWSLITAAVHDGRPEGVLLAVLATAGGYAAGRISGALLPVAAPCVGAVAGLATALALPHLPQGPRYAVPLGQAGAVAALLALSAGAACCASWGTSVRAWRLGLRALAAAIVLTGAVVGSAEGSVAGAAVLLCSLAAGSVTRRSVGIVALALAGAAAVATVWAVAEGVMPGGLAGALTERFDAHRVRLWRDALRLGFAEPGLGAGPGRFGELSGGASQVLPSDGTPHSAPLQQLAEQGVVGLLLLTSVFGWLLHALWRTSRPTPVALSAGAALTALAVIASVGDALSSTTVTAGAGLLAGWATARPWAGAEPTAL
ncbi:O-antigen ligase family protein [Streptomyces sp. NPDC090108]|uniref:O-antigen ligase family protein n=1 Tax=Streptomyces sp. NPDC090108 TaxID=3365947 RepID=UPI0037FC4413